MEGKLFTLQDPGDTHESCYVERYFVSYPFCGMKWFRTEPTADRLTRYSMSSSEGGWVYGGSLRVMSVFEEKSTVIKVKDMKNRAEKTKFKLYPFVLRVFNEAFGDITVTLAAENDIERSDWIEEINRAVYIQHFMTACFQSNTLPSRSICFATDEEKGALLIENYRLNSQILNAIILFRRFIEPSGCGLKFITLNNCCLTDQHMKFISHLMGFTPLLVSLSLVGNNISDAGAILLAEAFPHTLSLTELNVSANQIEDDGMTAIAHALSRDIKLVHLDVSENCLTDACSKTISMYLAGRGSQLARVNFSQNRKLGIGIVAFVVLLMKIQPPKIECIDLSYCGLTDEVYSDLAQSLAECKSLRVLNLKGNFMLPVSVCALFAAAEAHQQSFGRDFIPSNKRSKAWVFLDLQVMGLAEGASSRDNLPNILPKAMLVEKRNPNFLLGTFTQKDVKSTLLHLGLTSYLTELVLRRRPSEYLSSKDKRLSMDTRDLYMIKIKFCLNEKYTQSVSSSLMNLSRLIGIDYRRFLVISESPPDFSGSITVQVLILECNYVYGLEVIQGITDNRKSSAVFKTLITLVQDSHPLLRWIGISKVDFYANTSERSIIAPELDRFFTQPQSCPLKYVMTNSSGIITDFLPKILPEHERGIEDDMKSLMSNKTQNTTVSKLARAQVDIDDDELFYGEDALPDSEGSLDTQHARFIFSRGIYKGDNLEMEQIWYFNPEYDHITQKQKPGATNLELHALSWWVKDDHDSDKEEELQEDVHKTNDRMLYCLKTINDGKKDKKQGMLSPIALRFWSGSFGVGNCEDIVKGVLRRGLNENFMFPAADARKHLCDALYRRDRHDIERILSEIKESGYSGGSAVTYAEKLLLELEAFDKRSKALMVMENVGGEHIEAVESFLAICARLGYTGDDMFLAVSLRDQAVRAAVANKDMRVIRHIKYVKFRANLSNFMISRNIQGLREFLSTIETDIDKEMLEGMTETALARWLISECNVIGAMLQKSKIAHSLIDLEDAVARASYLHVVNIPEFQSAFDTMVELGGDIIPLYRRIIRGVVINNTPLLESAIAEAKRVAWIDDEVLSPEIIQAILARRNIVISEEILRESVLKTALGIKQGNPGPLGAVLHLLRHALKLDLHKHPDFKNYVDVLQKYLKQKPDITKAEEDIRQKINSGYLPSVLNVACARDEKVFVISASSKNLMQFWVEMLSKVALLSEDDPALSSVIFNGALEKAGSMKFSDIPRINTWDYLCRNLNMMTRETSHRVKQADKLFLEKATGWRHRHFVLTKHTLIYFTKAGGEKKGTINLKGAVIRPYTFDSLPEGMMENNRLFCFEIHPGKNMDNIDPDLLIHAKHMAKVMQKSACNKKLKACLRAANPTACSRVLEVIHALNMYGEINKKMLERVEALIHEQQVFFLRQNVRIAVDECFRQALREVVYDAKRLKVDTTSAILSKAVTLSERSLIELSILRARQTLTQRQFNVRLHKIPSFVEAERKFVSALTSVFRLEHVKFSNREQKLLVAIVMQNAGYSLLSHTSYGEYFSLAIRVIKAAVGKCGIFNVDTSALQLAKLCIALTDIEGFTAQDIFEQSSSGLLSSMKNLITTLFFETDPHAYAKGEEYAIEKYPFLRHIKRRANTTFDGSTLEVQLRQLRLVKRTITETVKSTSMATYLDSLKDYSPIMKWTDAGLLKHLVYGLSTENITLSKLIFEVLQCYMGDRLPTLVSYSAWKFLPSVSDPLFREVHLASELMKFGLENSSLRDEMYLHLIKQLNQPKTTSVARWLFTQNTSVMSRCRGWMLLSLYLHSFAPANTLLPYLRNFIYKTVESSAEEMKEYEKALAAAIKKYEDYLSRAEDLEGLDHVNQLYAGIQNFRNNLKNIKNEFSMYGYDTKRSEIEMNLDGLRSINRIAVYCSKLIGHIEQKYQVAHRVTDIVVDEAIIHNILSRSVVVVDVILMTGSVYRVPIRFGDVITPFGLLSTIYSRLTSSNVDEERELFGGTSEFLEFRSMSLEEKQEVLLAAFRGFSFYNAGSASENIDLLEIPVQPEESTRLMWTSDLYWDILMENHSLISDIFKSAFLSATNRSHIVAFGATDSSADLRYPEEPVTIAKRLFLRRRITSPTEKFVDDVTIFGPAVVDSPFYNSTDCWVNWLKEPVQQDTCIKMYILKTAKRKRKLDARLRRSGNAEEFLDLDSLLPPPPPTLPLPLPADHIRIDLLFAEESRYINSRMYSGSIDQNSYLLAIQMLLSWVHDHSYDENTPRVALDYNEQEGHRLGHDVPYGGIEVDMLAMNADISVRPSVRMEDGYGMCNRYIKEDQFIVEDENSSVADSDDNFEAGAATGDGNTVAGSTATPVLHHLRKYENHKVQSYSHHHNNYMDTLREYSSSSEEGEDATDDGSHSSLNGDIEDEFYQPTPIHLRADMIKDDDSDDQLEEEDGQFSDIFESVATDRTPHTVVDPNTIVNISMLSPSYLEIMEMKLKIFGISPSDDLLHGVVVYMEKFQVWARNLGVPFYSHRMRYYMKRAYLAYVRTWPWFGCHFLEGTLVEQISGMGNRRVVIAIGINGIHLLEPDTWALIFHTPFHDIERCAIEVPSAADQKVWSSTSKIMNFIINGMDMQLVSNSAFEIKNLIEGFVAEMLGRGIFPHGTEGGDDVSQTGLSAAINSLDQGVLLAEFTATFPDIPSPPVPPTMQFSTMHFEAPKSQRQILADKKVEMEIKDKEEAAKVQSDMTLKKFDAIDDLRLQGFFTSAKKTEVDEEHERLLENEEALQGSTVIRRKKGMKKAQIEAKSSEDRIKSHLQRLNATRREQIDSASRGVSLTKSLIISDEDDSRNVHQQAIHAQLSSFSSNTSYPLLSETHFTQQIYSLDSTFLPPVSISWPSDSIGEDYNSYEEPPDLESGTTLKMLQSYSDSEDENNDNFEETSTSTQVVPTVIPIQVLTTNSISELKTKAELEKHALLEIELRRREEEEEEKRLLEIEHREMLKSKIFWSESTLQFVSESNDHIFDASHSMSLFFTSSWNDFIENGFQDDQPATSVVQSTTQSLMGFV